MSISDHRLLDIRVSSDNIIAEVQTVSRGREMRTISNGVFFPLTIAGLAILAVAPLLVKAQSSSRTPAETSPYKGFSGLWVKSDSVKQVYYHDQTVAVVELGPRKRLENCELIEVTTPKEVNDTLQSLRSVSEPMSITFDEMFQLMNQCHDFVSPLETSENSNKTPRVTGTVFIGIVPGTKWCGNSDIAKTYFELGREKDVDKCCRTHDLCPVKVRSYRTRYNLTNENFYTNDTHQEIQVKLILCPNNMPLRYKGHGDKSLDSLDLNTYWKVNGDLGCASRVQILDVILGFFVHIQIQTGSGFHPVLYQVDNWPLSLGLKWLSYELDYSPPPNARLRMYV
ncbi:hypothetical protein B7P43_G04651 [Cryptotermes secundus]|uniref:phospholipase A2 n=1 Tax=Cryptotermes secundus TaxID=105785 RepID=A0A2J7QZG8_9NEOP|nr:hypothetical protein B7P43_G04651 [Cryptotermes secundus]